MLSSSQFDANSAFAGGGFMPSQPSQLANSTPYSARSRDTQGLIPVTVKQISEAFQSGDEKSNFIIDGVVVTNVQVSVVGMVFNINVRSSDIRFHLDDGTCQVECIRWVTENLDTREMDALEDGTYVRVNGHVQSFQGKKQLSVFSVRPAMNFDEVTCHFIECIYVHPLNSKVQGGALAQPQMANSSLSTPVRAASNGYQPALMNDLSMQYSADGLKGFDKLVLNYLRQPSNIDREMGVHVDELSQQLKAPVEKIKDAIDDYRYKAVEGC